MHPTRTGYARHGFGVLAVLWLCACTVSPKAPESAAEEAGRAQESRAAGEFEPNRRLNINPSSHALATAAAALRVMEGYDSNQGVAMLQLLEDVPSRSLTQIANTEPIASGLHSWPELALLMRQTLISGSDLHAAAADWAVKHPNHEVSEGNFVELANRYRQLFSIPSRIAVVLPVEGGLAAAGKAIRDGLISAFLNGSEDVTLRFYPTTDEPGSALSAYSKAVGEGAQWIIGPLRRESVQAVLNPGTLAVPALMLNTISGAKPVDQHNRLWSLSLSQAQEARAIARKALEQRHMSAIILSSNNSWGQRMEAAFSDEFIAGGGEIAARGQFDLSENDHSALLTRILKIDESRERKNSLQATLGIPLNFEPVRRDDFSLVFLAANPEQGRQLRPLLRFHDAGIKPVYAMSRIYAGEDDRAADQDLNGVIFPTTRWRLSRQTVVAGFELASLRGGSLASLHALGMDAWNVLPWLTLMQKDTDLQFPGALGSLSMQPDGQLLRNPAWAQFSSGRPVPVAWIVSED